MGNTRSKEKVDFSGEVCLSHFKILRSVGRGAFGKVCIVMKRDTKQLYAMKYMNKMKCVEQKAVRNVHHEREVLESLNHPLLVNLWFAFQDAVDMFMVVDLMLGGDLRFHLQTFGPLPVARVRNYAAEAGSALEYLHGQNIIHRDIKPDNILLDSQGHVRLADFNVAEYMPANGILTSKAGTRPYMAPEMMQNKGYGFGADWWSLGVTVFELLRDKLPFKGEGQEELTRQIVEKEIVYPSKWSATTVQFVSDLLERDPTLRIGTPNHMAQFCQHNFFSTLSCAWEDVPRLKIVPEYVPDKDKLNCDAMYELEEVMLEENPLYKRRQKPKGGSVSCNQRAFISSDANSGDNDMWILESKFTVYNREKLLRQKEDEIIPDKQPMACTEQPDNTRSNSTASQATSVESST